MTHDREPLDAQRIGDCAGVAGRRRHVPVWAGGRPAVAGTVVRYPADAEPVRGREKWLGRRPYVRRAVVPEDSEPAVHVARPRVVGVQRAAVAQLQIGLRYHPSSLRVVTLLDSPELRRIHLPRTPVNAW